MHQQQELSRSFLVCGYFLCPSRFPPVSSSSFELPLPLFPRRLMSIFRRGDTFPRFFFPYPSRDKFLKVPQLQLFNIIFTHRRNIGSADSNLCYFVFSMILFFPVKLMSELYAWRRLIVNFPSPFSCVPRQILNFFCGGENTGRILLVIQTE